MIHDFVVPLIAGMGIGAIIAFLSVSLGRSPVLERRRWKAIWANERWLKDLQDWQVKAESDLQKLVEALVDQGSLVLFKEVEK